MKQILRNQATIKLRPCSPEKKKKKKTKKIYDPHDVFWFKEMNVLVLHKSKKILCLITKKWPWLQQNEYFSIYFFEILNVLFQ